MGFKKPTIAIRKVLFELLCQSNVADAYFNASQIAELCNAAASFDEGEGINEHFVVWALTNEASKYNEQFDTVSGSENVGGFFYAAVSHRCERGGRITAVGRFTTADMEAKAWRRLIAGDLSLINVQNWDFNAVSAAAKSDFVKYMEANKDKIAKKNAESKEKESKK
jgi:hypothetical protein